MKERRKVLLAVNIQKELQTELGDYYNKCLDYIQNNKDNFDLVVCVFSNQGDVYGKATVDSIEFEADNIIYADIYDSDVKKFMPYADDKITVVGKEVPQVKGYLTLMVGLRTSFEVAI